MRIVGKSFGTMRLVDLERTVDSLNGRLREVQWELHRVKVEPLSIRLWRNLASFKGGQEFMSAVCNRRVRPNIKMVTHAHSRA